MSVCLTGYFFGKLFMTTDRLIDAIVVARNVNENCFSVKNEIEDAVNINPDFTEYVKKTSQFSNIKINEVRKPPNRNGNSLLLRYTEYSEILVSEDNECKQRYALCIELCHLLIGTDDPGKFVRNIIEQLKLSRKEMSSLKKDSLLNVEQFARILAIEILIPFPKRKKLKELITNGKTNYDIAYLFKVPEFLIESLITEKYFVLSNSIHKQL